MEKFIPYEKLSKKKQREQDARRRGTWALNPVTRKPVNPKAYDRKKAHKWNYDDSAGVLSFFGKQKRQPPRWAAKKVEHFGGICRRGRGRLSKGTQSER